MFRAQKVKRRARKLEARLTESTQSVRMSKVHIVDPNERDQLVASSPDGAKQGIHTPLTTLHENIHENMASQVSIVHTVEAMQMAVEEFGDHVDNCNGSFKQAIFDKVKALKRTDTTVLTERVEELKG